jgi:hypothetical protein
MFKRKINSCVKVTVIMLFAMAVMTQAGTAQRPLRYKPRTKSTALSLSLAATLMPVACGVALISKDDHFQGAVIGGVGMVLGPGIGHAYAGQTGRLATGSLIRIGGLVLMSAGALGDIGFSLKPRHPYTKSSGSDIDPMVVVGAAVCVFSAIYDIATVGRSVQKYNRSQRHARVDVRPVWFAQEKTPGLALTLTF